TGGVVGAHRLHPRGAGEPHPRQFDDLVTGVSARGSRGAGRRRRGCSCCWCRSRGRRGRRGRRGGGEPGGGGPRPWVQLLLVPEPRPPVPERPPVPVRRRPAQVPMPPPVLR